MRIVALLFALSFILIFGYAIILEVGRIHPCLHVRLWLNKLVEVWLQLQPRCRPATLFCVHIKVAIAAARRASLTIVKRSVVRAYYRLAVAVDQVVHLHFRIVEGRPVIISFYVGIGEDCSLRRVGRVGFGGC